MKPTLIMVKIFVERSNVLSNSQNQVFRILLKVERAEILCYDIIIEQSVVFLYNQDGTERGNIFSAKHFFAYLLVLFPIFYEGGSVPVLGPKVHRLGFTRRRLATY